MIGDHEGGTAVEESLAERCDFELEGVAMEEGVGAEGVGQPAGGEEDGAAAEVEPFGRAFVREDCWEGVLGMWGEGVLVPMMPDMRAAEIRSLRPLGGGGGGHGGELRGTLTTTPKGS
jgi:hypothetical protein